MPLSEPWDTALEKMTEFAILAEHKAKFDRGLAKSNLEPESPIRKLPEKLKVIDGGMDAIAAGLEAKTITTALVPKSVIDKPFEKNARHYSHALALADRQYPPASATRSFLLHVSKTPIGFQRRHA